ncbi:MAG: glycosyltransferase [Chloroflexia bacterium]|nr:glycosyltransferase [Chloroflexia bacterium]
MRIATPERPITFVEEPASWWITPLLPLYVLLAIPYIVWRVEISISQHLWYTVPLFIVEMFSLLTTVLHLILTRRLLHPVWLPPLEDRTVDAFIPTYNESSDIVEMTAIGALQIEGVRNVFILDDGSRAHIHELADRIGAIYLARHDNAHAKAGNMNFGLEHSDAEFVIFVDCDHVPQSSFIQRTLGYFRDEQLAFVQTPQVFYNFRGSIQFRKLPFRNLWNEQTMFYENIQPAKNRFNAAFFCGSGAILRRSALDSVGGFATGTATEDIHTSLRLHAEGWRSVFLGEPLAHGIAPEDFKEYHAQRVRWGAGSLGLLFRTADSPLVKRGLTPWQRLCYLASTNAYFYGGVIRVVYLAFPVIILLSVPFVSSDDRSYFMSYMSIALPFFVLSIVVTYLYSRRTFHPVHSEQFNIANILACLVALKGVVKVQKKFRVSIKSKRVKENPVAWSFLVSLAAIMGAADAFMISYWLLGLNASIGAIPSHAIMLAFFWNTFNLAFVLSLVRYLREFQKRPALAFPFHPRDSAVNLATGQRGHLESIGFQGAVLALDAFPATTTAHMEVNTRYGPIIISGLVSGRCALDGRSVVQLTFSNLTLAQKHRLTQYFFGEIVPKHFARDFAVKDQHTSTKYDWRVSHAPLNAIGLAHPLMSSPADADGQSEHTRHGEH